MHKWAYKRTRKRTVLTAFEHW